MVFLPFCRVTKDMLKIQNKRNEENDVGDEKLPSSCQKHLPVPFTRILDDTTTKSCTLSPKLLIWDAFINSLGQFEPLERVTYCSAMAPYIDQIIPQIFSLLPDSHLCKFFRSLFLQIKKNRLFFFVRRIID